MLILQRKLGQSLQIGDNITITVSSVENNRVRLSISAPEDVPILRSELVEARQTNRDSVAPPAAPEALLSLLEHSRHPEDPAGAPDDTSTPPDTP